MGYTHYFEGPKQPLSDEQWARVCDVTDRVIEEVKRGNIALAYEYDEPEVAPLVSDEAIQFNGVGDEGHETFWARKSGCGWQFCKTAEKPYDVACCAVLLALQDEGYEVGSDGDMGGDDWANGHALYERVREAQHEARVRSAESEYTRVHGDR